MKMGMSKGILGFIIGILAIGAAALAAKWVFNRWSVTRAIAAKLEA